MRRRDQVKDSLFNDEAFGWSLWWLILCWLVAWKLANPPYTADCEYWMASCTHHERGHRP